MSSVLNSRLLLENRLLSILPAYEFDFLKPHLETVSFAPGELIFQAGDKIRYVYFPLNGMVSLLSVTEQGNTVEVGFTGSEGMVGVPVILMQDEMPYQAMVQVSAKCSRIEAKYVTELFKQGGVFQKASLQYVYLILKQVSQTCICNHFHTIEARLCRWLSVMAERSEESHLSLTQEFLAQMLGVQRTSVGMIANNLQARGVIKYSRGKIEIKDLNALKGSVCECYHLVKSDYDSFLK